MIQKSVNGAFCKSIERIAIVVIPVPDYEIRGQAPAGPPAFLPPLIRSANQRCGAKVKARRGAGFGNDPISFVYSPKLDNGMYPISFVYSPKLSPH